MNQPALVNAFPIFREELSIRTGFHCGVILFSADKAFHES